ncbi:unnamed protein product [Effrenium voratum]|uniref:Uncharacterized protein n=2 Tax=Effrenium voratum TaxID=2562239 RepID=A0AA36JAG3_9DINO|nr:unnamed protein product [Effrenium voratum]CAJ1431534.1 unnamed protein product [Effrenium voratum]
MQQALAWASKQLEGVLVADGCCCAGKGPDAKYGDLVVMTDWDTNEGVPGFVDIPRLSEDPARAEASSSREYSPAEDLEDPLAAREVLQLRELMKNFVQEMVVGREVNIVVEEDQLEKGWLRLTPNLLQLRLDVDGASHEMLLRNIRDVRSGKMGHGPVKLDSLCCTLLLKGGECLSFRFQSLAERNRFAKCVKVLALALEQ